MLSLKSERTGMAAAAGWVGLQVEAHRHEHLLLRFCIQYRLVVTMGLDQCLCREARRFPASCREQELADRLGLTSEPLRVLVIGQHILELIAEYRQAARLQTDQRDPGTDRGTERLYDLNELAFGEIEHAVIVKRPAAA